MKYAQIKNGKVSNIIVLEDASLKSLFGAEMGFDALIKIDGLISFPGIGWGYDPETQHFSLPEDPDLA